MITITRKNKKSFDLYDSIKKIKLTNESFEEIVETKHFFVVRKDNKYGVYSRKGKLLENCEYLNFKITEKSKSLILVKTIGVNSTNLLLTKNNKCVDYFYEGHELPIKLADKSYTFVLVFGNNSQHFYHLWNTDRGYIFHPCSEVKIISNQTLKCRLGGTCLILDYLGNRINREGFVEIYGYLGGASLAKTSKKFGLIDINGDWIKRFEELDLNEIRDEWGVYANCLERGYNFLPFQRNGFYGLINYNENLIFEPISSCPIIFIKEDKKMAKGFAKVTINGLSGIIDEQLNWVVEPIYNDFKDAFIFSGHKKYEITHRCIPYIVKSPETNKYGLLSFRGNWIYPPIYDDIIQSMEDGTISMMKDYYLTFQKCDDQGNMAQTRKKIPFALIRWGFL